MITMNKTFLALGLTAALLSASDVFEKRTITEYTLPLQEITKIKSSEFDASSLSSKVSKFEKTSKVESSMKAQPEDILRGENILVFGANIKQDRLKAHNELLDIVLQNAKYIEGVNEKEVKFLINLLRIEEGKK